MTRFVIRWLDSPWAFEMMPGLNKLGRNPTNDFRISDPSVSSFHAEISLEQEEVRVRDLGSTNGTFIDEQRIDESLLASANVLRLGKVRFQLDRVPVIPMCQVAAAAGAPAAANPIAQVELSRVCALHADQRATYRCENCGGCFCPHCITVVGQGKFGETTVCPLCKGQCHALPVAEQERADSGSFLRRLTQTLKITRSDNDAGDDVRSL